MEKEQIIEKSIEILELPEVLRQCAFYAVSSEAKSRILALRPEKHPELCKDMLEETLTARQMIVKKGSPGFSGVQDISMSLKRLERGGDLNLRELLDIASLLRTAREVRAYTDTEDENSLNVYFGMLQSNRFLEDRITNSIVSEEEVADTASPALMDIRRHQRSIKDRIHTTLQKMISSVSMQKMLQDNVITIRQDRYVIPVKSEYRSAVSGLVHDVSSSGATYFIEPMQVVTLNNEAKELQGKEKAEIERIIAELSSACAENTETLRHDYETLVMLDVIFAKAKYADRLEGIAPNLTEDGSMYLKKIRHPLLDQKKAVPITIDLGRTFDTLVITGPNTGGKTVALKTTGLAVLMTECGLLIPAEEGSIVNIYETTYADIGDEQSISQSLSTFSAHMKNITEILSVADDRSLILFDELGAGTDPVEGAALAVSIIQYTQSFGAKTVATTHYAEVKQYAMTAARVENASCEFDVETLSPTYRLLIGIPGRSNAFAISSKLGLSDYIVDNARSMVSSEDRHFEDVISMIEQKRKDTEEINLQAARDRVAAKNARQDAETEKRKLETEREKILEEAKEEARKLLEEARETADRVQSELSRMQQQKAFDGAQRADMNRRLNEAEQKLGQKKAAVPLEGPPKDLKPGDDVELLRYGTKGTVLSEPKDGKVRVQAGIMQLTVKLTELRRDRSDNKKQTPAQKYLHKNPDEMRMLSAKTEVDLRGMNAEEGIMEMNRFLDSALLAGLNTVSIIHGKGTGILRKAVQEELRKNRQVKSFRLGKYGEGENGVTIVEFR